VSILCGSMVAHPRLIVAPQPHLVNDEQWATRWAPKHHADDIRICRCGCRRDRRVLCLLGSRAQWRVGDLAGPGAASLILFAWLLTHADVAFAGRAYAVCGGITALAVGRGRSRTRPLGRHRCCRRDCRRDDQSLRAAHLMKILHSLITSVVPLYL
jgi:hypothetical protein